MQYLFKKDHRQPHSNLIKGNPHGEDDVGGVDANPARRLIRQFSSIVVCKLDAMLIEYHAGFLWVFFFFPHSDAFNLLT